MFVSTVQGGTNETWGRSVPVSCFVEPFSGERPTKRGRFEANKAKREATNARTPILIYAL
eukprot:5291792-Lingulodinium_polyedra.AAC.1